jgi:hypothetical protein
MIQDPGLVKWAIKGLCSLAKFVHENVSDSDT